MKRFFKIVYIFTVCVLVGMENVACSDKGPQFRYEDEAALKSVINAPAPVYPAASFVVFSDAHVYASELGTEGAAFEQYLDNDRKLLKESPVIMQSLVHNVAQEQADFVLVSGDLTKDGERVSHDLMASFLSGIEESGKPVYVVPGNHDILNPESYQFNGDTTTRVPDLTAEQFVEIYGAFGFNEAIYRDTNSLSYMAEPEPGLWLLALDACLYKYNADTEITNGAFGIETLAWIEDRLIDAAQNHKAVIILMHHNIMEHYKGQDKYFGEYIVDNYEEVGKLFATYNVRLAFTGHYHAQDITEKHWEQPDKFIYDIETGSLVTYPNPYRVVTINADQKVNVQSKYITAVEGYAAGFQEYAREFVNGGIFNIAVKTLEDNGVSAAGSEIMAQMVGKAFIAHYSGDENLPEGQIAISSKGAGFRGWLVALMRGGMVRSLWKDLAPADNNLIIDLNSS